MATDDQRDGPGPGRPTTRNESTDTSVAGHLLQAGSVTGGVHLYGVPDEVPVPRQLPSAPRSFVGRDNELAVLSGSLDHGARPVGAVTISALAGTGGIGKTALALHWAHRNIDRFPDGQLFIDLRGFDPRKAPVPPDAALHAFLLALGVDAQAIPPDLDGKTGVYRTRVAGKRMLIVLDNAATADQAEPLLPGSPSCTVLVTSRRMLTALGTRHGARHVALPILSPEEAHALLAERIGETRRNAEPEAAAELIRLCGCHPLALALIASRADGEPDLSLTELVEDLRDSVLVALEDGGDPTVSLPDVLSWSLRGLTDQQRTVFGLLGIAPGPDISLAAAAGLTGLPGPQAKKILRELGQASLLNQPLGGRYAMHDVIRAFAADTATGEAGLELTGRAPDLTLAKEVRDAALRRVTDFYLHTAFDAARVLAPHRKPVELEPSVPGCGALPVPDTRAALAWFAAEHSCLLASQRTAAGLGRLPTVWALAWALHTFNRRQGHLQAEVTSWTAALKAASDLPDPATRALAHQYLGRIYAYLKRHEEASEHLRRALALAEERQDPANQAHAHILFSWAWEQRGDERRALEAAERALTLYRTLGDPVWEGRALNQVGWYAAHLGDYDRARELCEAALPLHHDRYPAGEASTLDTLGYIGHCTGRYRQAVQRYRQAIALCRELADTYSAANFLGRLGHSHAALGDHDQARAVWRESLALCRAQHRTEDAERLQRQLDALGQPSHGRSA